MPTDAAALDTVVPLWIGGVRVAPHSSRQGIVHNPSTGGEIRRVPFADAEDVDRAVQAATAAFPAWSATPALRRAHPHEVP